MGTESDNERKNGNTLFQVADLFIEQKMAATEIGKKLGISRQKVYSMLADAREAKYVRLVPPHQVRLQRDIAERFSLAPASIVVVDVEGADSGVHVASAAAELVMQRIKEVIRSGRLPVRIGLAPGRAMRDLSNHLGPLLSADAELPRKCLRLVATCSGCPADSPEYASSSFFNLFPREIIEGCVGLFAETLMKQKEFERIRNDPGKTGVAEAFAERDEIDVVVTAMGDMEDEHDLLVMFLRKANIDVDRLRTVKGWVGSIQYAPFSNTAPIAPGANEARAVTLFEIDELVELRDRKNKHIVLVARSCAICGRTRAKALLPLLKRSSLRAWSDLVMDAATGREILQLSNK